jgi:arginine utilization protein RocB
MQFYQRVHELTLSLVTHPSVTETPGEDTLADHIAALLRAMPVFARHPGRLELHVLPTGHDFTPRRNVIALVRGSGQRTVALAGHFDVVSVANYGLLEPLAFDPQALLPALIAELEAAPTRDADQEHALRDLKSGDFMPGRGALDMKSGCAMGMALLEHFAEQPRRLGNLLLILTPDEENYSHGMRSAAGQARALCERHGLTPVLSINLDASYLDRGQDVFMGSVGKLLPFAHIIGRASHVGAPFDGVNAALIAAELVREVEGNPDYADPDGAGDPAAKLVPVTLRAADLKRHYDVTTPEQAFVAFNMLTGSRTPDQILDALMRAGEHALDAVFSQLGARATRANASFGVNRGRVYRLSDLISRADLALLDPGVEGRGLNALDVALHVSSRVIQSAALAGPAVVFGFAPVFYPLVRVIPESDAERQVQGWVRAAAAACEVPVNFKPVFTGISDMSFLGTSGAPGVWEAWRANAVADARWRIPETAQQGLGAPVINIGPSGFDFHQRTERVHMQMSFETAPQLVWRVIGAALD